MGNSEAEVRQHFVRRRPSDSENSDRIAKFLHFYLVHDDVTAKLGKECGLSPVDIKNQGFAAIEGIKVALNLALWIQDEGVNAAARREVANVVTDHAVQPANAIFSGERHRSAV